MPDFLPDDSALVYNGREGLIIITGCSHAGICNIISQARKITGVDRVADIIGGLHLLEPPAEQLQATVDYLKKIKLSRLHACHCTDFNRQGGTVGSS